ncbi:MAG: hypothetical protein KAW03_07395, partial [Candidatus Lokiarchaeota archaeon]|nr:hypothetical protein [Candidatus Lokiarchaeota archaeon]
MISKIFIIAKDGVLCYSKSFFGSGHRDTEIVNFLTSINHVGKTVGLGEIKSLNFSNLNIIYSYDDYNCMYIITADIDDPEEDIRDKLELIKKEFIAKYRDQLENWNGKAKKFKDFDQFTESHVFIPPKILLAGEDGVGKSTIMGLFPGETILELDDDMNEIIQKTINSPNFEGISEFILREVNMQDLVGYSKIYKMLLDSADIICLVTNSGAGNLSRTKQLFLELKQKTNKADFYIIANFQDLVNTSFEPEKINESFGIKTFGFSAIRADAKDIIYKVINIILKNSIIDKIENK